MKRILNNQATKNVGETIKVAGWVQTIRSHGKIIFFDLRDRSGILQIVFSPESEACGVAQTIKPEWVVEIIGVLSKRPDKMVNEKIETGGVEMKAEEIKILAESASIPFDFMEQELKASLPTLLDYRPLTVRNEKVKAAFKVGNEITNSFRKTLKEMDFIEFQSPNIVPAVAEGGAEIFKIDYYKYHAYLAQSPQLYKQIMLGAYERVFTVTHVYRAEPSVTTRHLSEYCSLDAEIAFIESWEEIMDVCEELVKKIFEDVWENCKKEAEFYGFKKPETDKKIPRIKMREAQQLIYERTKRDHRKEPDLDPEDEKEICQWAKEKHCSELLFITHYPTKKRPFYTFPDADDPDHTLSFDLLYRGLEVVTGGQRIHDYQTLLKNIKKWGNDPKDFSFYLQAFKYGMPPEGGFAIGLERMIKQVLGLKNVREAAPFPRDMERIDQKLSLLQRKKKIKKSQK